jgi:hypothetical protein
MAIVLASAAAWSEANPSRRLSRSRNKDLRTRDFDLRGQYTIPLRRLSGVDNQLFWCRKIIGINDDVLSPCAAARVASSDRSLMSGQTGLYLKIIGAAPVCLMALPQAVNAVYA